MDFNVVMLWVLATLMASGIKEIRGETQIGDLYLRVLDTQTLVGYDASLPYIRDGKVQKQAVSHIFQVDNDVDHQKFQLESEKGVIVYNISVQIFPKRDGVVGGQIYFEGMTPDTVSNDWTEIAIKDHLDKDNKSQIIDVVAKCDPKKQPDQNRTMRIKITFNFKVVLTGGSTKSQPVVQVVVNRDKKCYLERQEGDAQRNGNTTTGSEVPQPWPPIDSSSSSVFFVSIGISLGVIFIICVVVAFYHFTTFKPQQRKNKFYNELPYSDPNAAQGGRVPMFMPKSTNNAANYYSAPPGHVTFTSAGMNSNNPQVQIMPGGSQQGSSDCTTSPFLNQSKISDGSMNPAAISQSNGADNNCYYQDPSCPPPNLLGAMNNTQHPSAVYNKAQGQACCYPQPQSQRRPPQHPIVNRVGSNPVELMEKLDLSGNSADSGLDMTGQQIAQNPNQPGGTGTGTLSIKFADIEVAKEKITFHEILVEGTFGRLCRGFVAIPREPNSPHTGQEGDREVYIKTVAANSSPAQIEMMLREGGRFKQVNYKHILPLSGVVCPNYLLANNTVVSPPMLLYPYSANGNLKLFLKHMRENHQTLTTKEVVGMAVHIAKAVQYLEKKKTVVGDLATRNCVVDERLGVKITDSALARDVFPNDYHCLGDELNRPVKWLSPESLLTYTTEAPADVWSFGVTVWELLTFAQQPFLETDPFEMLTYLRQGNRLLQPLNCPDELFRLMESCWCWEWEERPKISKLLSYLIDFNKTLGAYI